MPWQRVQRFGDRLTPAMRRRLLAELRRAQARVPISAIEAMIEHYGMMPARVAALFEALPAMLNRAALPVLREATTGAAVIARESLSDRLTVSGQLRLVNPRAVEVANQQSARLVTRVSVESRTAIQRVVSTAIAEGLPPRDAARLIRHVVGLNRGQSEAVLHFRRRLVARGAAVEQARQAAEKYAAKLLRQRATMIARTEIIDSLTAGQQATWADAQRDGLLPASAKQRWVITPDDRLCRVCAQMTGERALAPIGGLFDTPLGPKRGPAMHPHCRCSVVIDARSVRVPVRRAA